MDLIACPSTPRPQIKPSTLRKQTARRAGSMKAFHQSKVRGALSQQFPEISTHEKDESYHTHSRTRQSEIWKHLSCRRCANSANYWQKVGRKESWTIFLRCLIICHLISWGICVLGRPFQCRREKTIDLWRSSFQDVSGTILSYGYYLFFTFQLRIHFISLLPFTTAKKKG